LKIIRNTPQYSTALGELQKELVGDVLEFSLSKGWVDRFYQRCNLHNTFSSEAASAHQSAACLLPAKRLNVM
jgi:hypothetical protein